MAEAEEAALEFTPTWIVAAVCSIIVLLSLVAERCLHYLGKVTLRMCTRRVRFIDMAPHSISRCLPVALISSHLGVVVLLLQKLEKKNQKPLYEALLKVKEGTAPHFSPPFLRSYDPYRRFKNLCSFLFHGYGIPLNWGDWLVRFDCDWWLLYCKNAS